jgi:tRNA A-37 threonylcarbamoyl transferase component Bud32
MKAAPRTLGRYTLVRRLATGGMGEVFLAEVQGAANFTKRVAIKRILPHLARNEDFVRKFIDEANVMVQLHHGNIVQVIELVEVEGELFLVMEYLPGRDLKAVLRRVRDQQRPFPADLAAWVVAEVCDGLDYAHRKTGADGRPLHIVHRDVSPSNIVLGAGGEVKLLDFGIARARGGLHQSVSGMLQGKFVYMSPEQAEGKRTDARADVFSAGLVLYELLCGVRPLEGESETETLRLVRDCRIARPTSHRAELPPNLEALVMKAVAREPEERFASASEMRRELLNALHAMGGAADAGSLARFLAEIFPEGVVPGDGPDAPLSLDDALAMQLGALTPGAAIGHTRTLTGPSGASPATPHTPAQVALTPGTGPLPSLPGVSGPMPTLPPPRRRSRIVAAVTSTVAVVAIGLLGWQLWPRTAILIPIVTPANAPGLTISVDDKPWTPPIHVRAGGEYRVCVEAEGYLRRCSLVYAERGTMTPPFDLLPEPTLVVKSEPAEAHLTLENEPLAGTRTLKPGQEYHLCGTAAGYRPACVTFTAEPGPNEPVLRLQREAPDAGVAAPPPDAGAPPSEAPREPVREPVVHEGPARHVVHLHLSPPEAVAWEGAQRLAGNTLVLIGEQSREVRVEAPGYASATFHVGPGDDDRPFEMALQKLPTGTLFARAIPDAAKLYLDEKAVENPLKDVPIPAGEHVLKAVWEGSGHPKVKKFAIAAGESRREVLDFTAPEEAP